MLEAQLSSITVSEGFNTSSPSLITFRALLPQENAHFSISESLIAAIELMKCNMMSQCLEEEEEEEEDSDREIQELKQKIRLRRQQIRTKNLRPVYQETEHGSEWGREHLSSASAGLRDDTWCLVRFLFGPTLR